MPRRAHSILEAARDQHPDRVEYWTALAELANRVGTPDASLSIIDQAERRLGSRADLRLARLSPLIKRDGTSATQSLAAVEKGLEAFSADDQERLLRGVANAHLLTGNARGAEPLVTRLAGLRPFDLSVRFKQFEVACQLGDQAKIGAALQSIEAIEKDWHKGEIGGGPVVRLCKARLVIWRANRQGPLTVKRQELEDARLLLAAAGLQIASWPILSLSQAEIDDLLGDSERALKGYRRVLSQGLETSTLIRRVATILYALGRFDEADETIRGWNERGLGANDRELAQLERKSRFASMTGLERWRLRSKRFRPTPRTTGNTFGSAGSSGLAASNSKPSERCVRQPTLPPTPRTPG